MGPAIRKKECEPPRQDLATPSQQMHFERFLQVERTATGFGALVVRVHAHPKEVLRLDSIWSYAR
jgi:hypothetical protein